MCGVFVIYDNSKLCSALNIIQLSVCKYTSISMFHDNGAEE